MNLPNILTVSRLFLAFVLIPLIVCDIPFGKSVALVLFVLGGITDYLDGHLARNVYGTTAFGKLMDPVTDKVMVCAAFVSFVELQLVKAIVVVVIISREFIVTGLRLLALNEGKVIAAGAWGKHKTIWQIVAVAIILLGLSIQYDILPHRNPALLSDFCRAFGTVAHLLSIAVALLTVVSGCMYLYQHRALCLSDLQ